MSHNRLFSLLLTALLGGCVHTPADPNVLDNPRLVGIWAMQPLPDGIANVTEFRADGKALLYPFNCNDPRQPQADTADYQLADDGRTIRVSSSPEQFELKVLAFAPGSLQVSMALDEQYVVLDYSKVDTLMPHCERWLTPAEQARRTPYQPGNFVPAAQIPAHANLSRYLGKWADNGQVRIEIRRDPQGHAALYPPGDPQWHELYNEVRWVGNALHFQSFVYADQPALFSAPEHKRQTLTIVQPTADGKLSYTRMVNGEVITQVLSRMP